MFISVHPTKHLSKDSEGEVTIEFCPGILLLPISNIRRMMDEEGLIAIEEFPDRYGTFSIYIVTEKISNILSQIDSNGKESGYK